MCARYTLTVPERLRELFPRMRFPAIKPRYNIAPSQPVLGARNAGNGTAELLLWGPVHINARAETLAAKRSFKEALRTRRALVFADGYIEWHARSGVLKQPYRVHLDADAPFAFAALWNELPLEGEGTKYSCVLVTTQARADLAWLHDRMPVILEPQAAEAWMNPDPLRPGSEAELLVQPSARLVATPISRAVNSALRDEPLVLTPVEPPIQDSLF